MKIDLYLKPGEPYLARWLLDNARLLADHGWLVRDRTGFDLAARTDADLDVVHHERLPTDLYRLRRPTAVMERYDSAISRDLVVVACPAVVRVLKVAVLRDPSLHLATGRRWHVEILDENQSPTPRGGVRPTPEQLAKIVPGPGYWCWDELAGLRRAAAAADVWLDSGRSVVAHFAGTTAYGGQRAITNHRRMAVRRIEDWAAANPGWWVVAESGRPAPREVFWMQLQGTRACVSPWGFGEACYRDFEAVLCGALLLKPDSGHVRMEPDLFDPADPLYLPCEPHFRGLGSLLDRVRDDWDSFRPLRVRALDAVRRCLTPEWAVGLARRILGDP